MKKTGKKILLAVMMALLFSAAGVGQSMASTTGVLTITETMDHVFSDNYSSQHDYPLPPNMWDVVRFDVTNNGAALGVYGVMIGAVPGRYSWGSSSVDAMQFGGPWAPGDLVPPVNAGEPYQYENRIMYLPQYGDWSTSLLEVRDNTTGGHFVDLSNGDGASIDSNNLNLPATFDGYENVYWFETVGPFIACSGGSCGNSVPIQDGQTFSFFVTGGLASPFLYLTADNYNTSYDPNNPNGLPRTGFTGTGMTQTQHGVPEPVTMLLLGLGLFSVAGVRRMMGN